MCGLLYVGLAKVLKLKPQSIVDICKNYMYKFSMSNVTNTMNIVVIIRVISIIIIINLIIITIIINIIYYCSCLLC